MDTIGLLREQLHGAKPGAHGLCVLPDKHQCLFSRPVFCSRVIAGQDEYLPAQQPLTIA
jgi:hypothetical protein